MSWIVAGLAAIVFTLFTAGAFMASAAGWGLPGKLDRPVSIREGSVGTPRRAGTFLYFGTTRRHLGGGFHGGK